jgi:hypothetical protein
VGEFVSEFSVPERVERMSRKVYDQMSKWVSVLVGKGVGECQSELSINNFHAIHSPVFCSVIIPVKEELRVLSLQNEILLTQLPLKFHGEDHKTLL